MRTVGVSIPIPEPYFSQLRAMRVDVQDPQADAVPPHVTLLPPTDIAKVSIPNYLDYLREAASKVDPFDMILRGTGTFRPVSPVVFIQVAQGVSRCEQLERLVRSGPVERKLEFSYHPHITIAHNLDEERLDRAFTVNARFEASFRVSSFSMYYQDEAGVWTPVETIQLGSGESADTSPDAQAGSGSNQSG